MATAEQIRAVEEWMKAQFPDHYVDTHRIEEVSDYSQGGERIPNDLQHEPAHMFAARKEKAESGSHRKELGVAHTAFEYKDLHEILDALDLCGVADRLRDDPSRRLLLTSA